MDDLKIRKELFHQSVDKPLNVSKVVTTYSSIPRYQMKIDRQKNKKIDLSQALSLEEASSQNPFYAYAVRHNGLIFRILEKKREEKLKTLN